MIMSKMKTVGVWCRRLCALSPRPADLAFVGPPHLQAFRTINDFYLTLKDEVCFPQVSPPCATHDRARLPLPALLVAVPSSLRPALRPWQRNPPPPKLTICPCFDPHLRPYRRFLP